MRERVRPEISEAHPASFSKIQLGNTRPLTWSKGRGVERTAHWSVVNSAPYNVLRAKLPTLELSTSRRLRALTGVLFVVVPSLNSASWAGAGEP